jgi:Ca2+-binding RTX toxin-like protein
MATILFSGIADGSTISFDPASDVLLFDLSSISAASVGLTWGGGYTGVGMMAGAISFSLPASVSLLSLTPGNVTFADRSCLLVGDGTLGQEDALANVLVGTDQSDQLLGLGGADALVSGAGDDLLDGGTGNDVMKGGLGSDTYVVDAAADVVDETPTVDPVLVSADAAGQQRIAASDVPQISADGRYAVFRSNAIDFVPGPYYFGQKIFRKDLQTGTIEYVSTDASGVPDNWSFSYSPQISADGRYVVFDSDADALMAGDTNYLRDVFLKDLQTGAIQRVSTTAGGGEGNGASTSAQRSADGRYVLFQSDATNLVPGDDNAKTDLFVKDTDTGTILRVSTDAVGAQANGASTNGRFSPDGAYVVFDSVASNLVADDGNGAVSDVFVKDWADGDIRCVSTSAAGVQGNSTSSNAQFSADGRFVLFQSLASNLVAVDANGQHWDVFRKNLQTGAIRLVSTDAAGVQGDLDSFNASLDASGRYVAFESWAANLVSGDSNGWPDIFVKDLQTGAIRCVSTSAAGAAANGPSTNARISADGRFVVFQTAARNLFLHDDNDNYDVVRVRNPLCTDAAVDTVQAGVTYTLPAAVENLTLTGASAIDGTGNALANLVTGNDAANLLNGGGGADTMVGLGGDDTYVVNHAGDVVTEAAGGGTDLVKSGVTFSFAMAGRGELENLTLTGQAAIDGTGNAKANAIAGNGATNVLQGGGGNDSLNGNVGDDSLGGAAGDDTLSGGEGADTLRGGLGSDTYVVDDGGDQVTESSDALNGGVDLVKSSVSHTLGSYQEQLTLTGTAPIDGTGNAVPNTLTGNGAANRLQGAGGNDTLIGYGDDDTLVGGVGNDVLTGGVGKDAFRFDTWPNAATNRDTITSFVRADDIIQLENDVVFNALGDGPLDPDAFCKGPGLAVAQDAEDRVIYDASAGTLYYDGDGTGTAKQPVPFATLANLPALTCQDFWVT